MHPNYQRSDPDWWGCESIQTTASKLGSIQWKLVRSVLQSLSMQNSSILNARGVRMFRPTALLQKVAGFQKVTVTITLNERMQSLLQHSGTKPLKLQTAWTEEQMTCILDKNRWSWQSVSSPESLTSMSGLRAGGTAGSSKLKVIVEYLYWAEGRRGLSLSKSKLSGL